eukprot:PhM_4_TR19069/c0_g1_i1/m.54067
MSLLVDVYPSSSSPDRALPTAQTQQPSALSMSSYALSFIWSSPSTSASTSSVTTTTTPSNQPPITYFAFNQTYTRLLFATRLGQYGRVTLNIKNDKREEQNEEEVVELIDVEGGGVIGVVAPLMETHRVCISGAPTSTGHPCVDMSAVHFVSGNTVVRPSNIPLVPDRVLGLSLLARHIIIVTEHSVYIFNYAVDPVETVAHIPTARNPWGVFAVHVESAHVAWLLLPGTQEGSVVMYNAISGQPRYTVTPHRTRVGLLVFSKDGVLFASASESSTAIKVSQRATGELQRELRRATAHRCRSFFAAFCPNNKFVCVLSERGTLHFFSLGDPRPPMAYETNPERRNTRSTLQVVAPYLSTFTTYFDSEWAAGIATVPTHLQGVPSVCTWLSERKLALFAATGDVLHYTYDVHTGAVELTETSMLIQPTAASLSVKPK